MADINDILSRFDTQEPVVEDNANLNGILAKFDAPATPQEPVASDDGLGGILSKFGQPAQEPTVESDNLQGILEKANTGKPPIRPSQALQQNVSPALSNSFKTDTETQGGVGQNIPNNTGLLPSGDSVPSVSSGEYLNEARARLQAAEEGTPEYDKAKRDYDYFRKVKDTEVEAAMEGQVAKTQEGALRSAYMGARGVAGGASLGLTDLALRKLEKGITGDKIVAENTEEQVVDMLGRTAGALASGGKIVELLGKKGLSAVTTRIAAGAITGVTQNAVQVLNGDKTVKEGAYDALASTVMAGIGLIPELKVAPGMANFVSQVVTQVGLDVVNDALFTGRLTKENYKDWALNELPNVALALVFAGRDMSDKNFPKTQVEMQKQVASIGEKIKTQVQKAMGKDVPIVGKPLSEQPYPVVYKQAQEAGITEEVGTSRSAMESRIEANNSVGYVIDVDPKTGDVVTSTKPVDQEIPEGSHEIRTVTRTAEGGPFQPEAISSRERGTNIRKNVSINGAQAESKDMTDSELGAMFGAEKDNNLKVVYGVELINRAKAKGQDTAPYFDKMVEKGSDAGLVLRTMHLLNASPEGYVQSLNKKMSEQGRAIPADIQTKIAEGSQKASDAVVKARDAETKFRNNPTKANNKAMDKAYADAEAASRESLSTVAKVLPKTWGNTIFSLMQGNLLSPISQAYNLIGNIINEPVRGSAHLVAKSTELVSNMIRSSVGAKTKTTVAAPSLRILGAWTKGLAKGVPKAWQVIRHGATPELSAGGEVRGSLHPIESIVQAVTGKGMVVDAVTGKPKLVDRSQRFIQGIFGAHAEVMFRGLAAFDTVFKSAAYRRALAQEVSLREANTGKPMSPEARKVMMDAPSYQTKNTAMGQAEKDVYQNKNAASGLIERLPPAARVLLGQVYARTPTNLIIEMANYIVPEIPVGKAVWYAEKSRRLSAEAQRATSPQKKAALQKEAAEARGSSAMAVGQATVGYVLGTVASYFAANNLIQTTPGEDKKRVRQVTWQGVPDRSLNVSGLNRVMAGGSGDYQAGDKLIGITNFGVLGALLMANANSKSMDITDAMKSEGAVDPKIGTYLDKRARNAMGGGQAMFSLSTAKGAYNFIDAIANLEKEGKVNQLAGNWIDMVSSIAVPGTVKASIRAGFGSPLVDTTDRELGKSIMNKVSTIFPQFSERFNDLPKRRDLWGRPITTVPEGRSPELWSYINVLKNRNIPDDPASKLIYDTFIKSGEIKAIPSVPSRGDLFSKEKIKDLGPVAAMAEGWVNRMGNQTFDKYVETVGEYRFKRVRSEMNSGALSDMSPDFVAERLAKIYEQEDEKARLYIQGLVRSKKIDVTK